MTIRRRGPKFAPIIRNTVRLLGLTLLSASCAKEPVDEQDDSSDPSSGGSSTPTASVTGTTPTTTQSDTSSSSTTQSDTSSSSTSSGETDPPGSVDSPACPFTAGAARFYLSGPEVNEFENFEWIDSGWIGCVNDANSWTNFPTFKRLEKKECRFSPYMSECTKDSDCQAGETCVCAAYYLPGKNPFWDEALGEREFDQFNYASNLCYPDHCEAECGGLGCGMSVDWCGSHEELRCHTSADECHTHDECRLKNGEPEYCRYDKEVEHWRCLPRAECE